MNTRNELYRLMCEIVDHHLMREENGTLESGQRDGFMLLVLTFDGVMMHSGADLDGRLMRRAVISQMRRYHELWVGRTTPRPLQPPSFLDNILRGRAARSTR